MVLPTLQPARRHFHVSLPTVALPLPITRHAQIGGTLETVTTQSVLDTVKVVVFERVTYITPGNG